MEFNSILFDNYDVLKEIQDQPSYFKDLNLTQVLDSIVHDKTDYNLQPFYYNPLQNADLIKYRQEIMKDLDNDLLLGAIETFAQKMILVRRYLQYIPQLNFDYHKKSWFLEATLMYCQAVTDLKLQLQVAKPHSKGLNSFYTYLEDYIEHSNFKVVHSDSLHIKEHLSEIRYCVNVQNGKFTVMKYKGEEDFSIEVLKTFERFKQGSTNDYTVRLKNKSGMNHIEAKILEFVVRLFPEPFLLLDTFYDNYKSFIEDKIIKFDREIQFYVSYVRFTKSLKKYGLNFCYPKLTQTKDEVFDYDGFDLALANKLVRRNEKIICNDFHLEKQVRTILVSGPNQGGKTTFARMFGQLHYFARLGCPIPGSRAKIYLSDNIFTHFEKEENITDQRGKLHEELERIHDILANSTSNSIIIINEIFSSTALKDGIYLGKEIIQRIEKLDMYTVMVTFMDELTTFSPKTISMVSTVNPDNPAQRTFKIVRKPSDGLAYAFSLAKKHQLTYDQILERIDS